MVNCASWLRAWSPVLALLGVAGSPAAPAQGLALAGYAGLELRGFTEAPVSPAQSRNTISGVLRPELYTSWDDGSQSAVFTPFLRVDSADPQRTHFDVRELYWERVGRDWELRLGIAQVFWGVMESQHLVDIINQTDLVENPDREDKLGQPMVNLALIRPWGTLDLFVLPGFRERTFPGRRGRLRSHPPVATGAADYESSLEQTHVDFAARWSHVLGPVDVGLYHFYGTSRDPTLRPGVTATGKPIMVPRYELVHQSGLDLQVTQASLLWKLEAVHRAGQGSSFVAVSAGVEYTRVGVLDTAADLGLLAEYHFDSAGRGNALNFPDDVFAGVRLTLNDVQSTQVLAGVLLERTGDGRVLSVEASRRLGESWTAELEVRLFDDFEAPGKRAHFTEDDYVQLGFFRHF